MITNVLIVLLVGCILSVANGIARNIDLLNFASGPSTGYKIFGATANATSLVTTAGDFNGDGLKDVLIGSFHGSYGGRNDNGVCYVIFGSQAYNTTALDLAQFKSGSAGVRVYGRANSDQIGHNIEGGGDINGDGYDDVLIGTHFADPDGTGSAGSVWVLFGHSAALPYVDINLAALSPSYGFRIRGAVTNDAMNASAFLGDMNGDGYDDIIVGAAQVDAVTSNEGRVYVIFGKKTFVDMNVGTYVFGTGQGFTFSGGVANARLGLNLGRVGDFNGDGYADAIAPCSYLASGSTAYILFGHSNETAFPNLLESAWVTSSATGFKITGPAYTRPHGSAGDVNGDGIDDFTMITQGTGNYGYTFVLFGHRGGSFPDLTLPGYLTPSTGFYIKGAAVGDWALGAIVGDVNKDGYLDFGINAQEADPVGRIDAGLGYIVYGHSNATAFDPVLLAGFTTSDDTGYMIIGAHAEDSWISWAPNIARLGDVNGDGVDDVGYSSFFGNVPGRPDCGVTYILLSDNRYPTSQPSSQPTRQPTLQPSAQPSRQPTSLPTHPTSQPSRQPTSRPSCQPSARPSSQPSSQPSIESATRQSILTSPTYKVRNGFAFAVVTADGKGLTWGEADYGGDSSAAQSALQSGVQGIVGARFAYAAVKTDGSASVWGTNMSFSWFARYESLSYALTTLVATEAAFAGIDTATGRVIAIGSKHHGGDVLDDAHCNGYSSQLSAGVRSIVASSAAFAAIKTDGTVLAWGNKFAGGDVSNVLLSTLTGAKMVVATAAAFAVLRADNRVTAWGDHMLGGDASAVAGQLQEVHHLVASRSGFAAFKKDSSLVVWGYRQYGGDTSAVAAALSSDVVHVAHTFTAMAAIKADGSVVAWGKSNAGGDASSVQSSLQNVVRVYGNSKAFAALTATGGVVTWGRADHGGVVPVHKQAALSSGVVSIYNTDRAFAALKSNGALVVWGQAGHGGSPSAAVEALLTSGVHTVCTNDVAFSAIKTDGSVVVWGHSTAAAVQGVLFTSASLTQPAICA